MYVLFFIQHGSVLRLTDSGEIPVDNPYTGDGTARCNEEGETDSDLICQEVFAVGLRNPFRFTMDPHSTDKVRFLIADVGAETWEELNVGGADYVGANYGWPDLEGPCYWHDRDECPIGDPNAEYDNPIYWYQHDSEEEGCALGMAIPPPNLAWPAPYNDPNSFFLAEYVWGEIYHITEDPSEYCDTCNPPRHGYSTEIFHQYGRPIGLKFGPYIDHSGGSGASTALYYTYREGTIDIRRIIYKGGDNFAPVVTFTADRSNVGLGGTIQFDASGTFDPNHAIDELDFFWSFGDDSPQASGVVVEHQYEAIGVYTVTLTAYDPEGAINSYTMEVSVGAMPTVNILNPAEGTTFAVGDVFLLVGEGTDAYGNLLVDSDFTWEVRQHHKNHFHPYLPEDTVGNTIAIDPAPEPEDFFAAGNSHLEVLLTGTDSLGISATVSRIVMPKTLEVDFDTIPTGLTLQIDEQQLTMPQRILTWENHNLRVFALDQGEYTFSSWVDGVAQNQTDTINVPRGSSTSGENLTFVAVFEPTAAEVTPEVPAPPTETNTTNDVCTPERSPCGDFVPECCAGTVCGVGDRDTCTACSLEGVTCGPNRRVCCAGLICNEDASECQPLVVATLSPTGQPSAAPVVLATRSPTGQPSAAPSERAIVSTPSPTVAASKADADVSSATEDDAAADKDLSSEAGSEGNIVLNQSGSASMTVWRWWIDWNLIPFLLLPVLGYF